VISNEQAHVFIASKLHVLLMFCLFFTFQFHQSCCTTMSHSGPHKKVLVKVCRKLKKDEKHCIKLQRRHNVGSCSAHAKQGGCQVSQQ